MDKDEQAEVTRDFRQAVNMTAGEIERWLETEESKSVGYKGEDGTDRESVGHASGRHIIRILHTKNADLSDDDYGHMRKVVGYVHRHLAQRPADVQTSPWRYSLMNWGHDPTKKE